jgi:sugar phosphate isomerase/epimerase
MLTLPDFIAKARNLGYGEVLLMAKRPHLSVPDADTATLNAVKAALRDHEVRCIGLACYNDILLKGPAEVPVGEMQLLYIETAARTASELGGNLLRIFTGYLPEGTDFWQARRRIVDFLGEAGMRAARYGITLAVQNHHDFAVDTRAMAELLDETGLANVRAGYDAWSPFLRGEDLDEGARLMAPRTALTIAANYVRRPRYAYLPDLVNYRREYPDFVQATAMEEGEIDYAPFLRELRKGGFEGPVVYEMCSPLAGGPSLENLDRKAKSFLAYIKKVV